MSDFLAPVGPPTDVTDPASRELIAALYEHDWYTEPPTSGRATVVSPDFTRVMVIELEGERLLAYINDQLQHPTWAIEYVRGGRA